MDNESNTPETPRPFITQSAEINELAGALSLAQGEMKPARKGASNPFFKSKYADLSEVIEASRYPLTGNDLSIVQYCDDGYVVTQLMHSSGQWLRGRLRIQPKDNTPQGIGSALTYARRYSWQMMVGIGAEDDDGEAAMGRAGSAYDPAHAEPTPKKRKTTPKKTRAKKKTEPKPVLDDGKGNSEVKTMEQAQFEEKTETVGDKEEQPVTETVAETPTLDDEVNAILTKLPDAEAYLKDLNIHLPPMPDSVKQRILEKGLDGFGEMVATWKAEKEESK